MQPNWAGTNESGKKVGHLKNWNTHKEILNIEYPVSHKITAIIWNKKFKINTESFGPQYEHMLSHSQITVYTTDGSKTK